MTHQGISVYRLQSGFRFTVVRAESVPAQGGHQPVGIEDGVAFEHIKDGPGQLDGQHGVGLELVVEPRFEPLREGADDERIAFGDHGGFAKGPAEIGVAQFGSPQPLDLAGAGDGTFDQAAIGEEIFDGGKTVNGADFVQQGQPEIVADAGHGLEQGEVAAGGLPGEFEEFFFEDGQLGVVVADEGQIVLQGELADGIRFRGEQLFGPSRAVVNVLAARRPVICQLLGLDAGEQFTAVPDVEQALAQQGTQRSLRGRINIAWRNEVGPEQVGDFFGVDPVVFVFAAVDGLEVKGVGQYEVKARISAGIGEPIPAEHALGADGQVVAIRGDELEEIGEVVVLDVGVDELLASPIHDADVHLAGVEINSAVEFGGRGVVFHG